MADLKITSMIGLTDRSALKRVAALLALVMTAEAATVPLAQAAMIAHPAPMGATAGFMNPVLPVGRAARTNFIAPFRLPASIGASVEVHSPVSAGRIVYHLQDVHGNVAAQTNLSEIVTRLAAYAQAQGKTLVVAVEGAVGTVNTDELSAMSDEKSKDAVTAGLIRSGFLMGEERAAIINKPGAIKIVGVESAPLYNENVLARERSKDARERVLNMIRGIKQQLTTLEQHNFSPLLLQLEKNRVAVEEGRMQMGDYLIFLSHTSPALVKKSPMASRMLSVAEQEKTIDFSAVEKEGRQLVEELIRKKDQKDVERIMKDAVALREGRISPLSYYQSLMSQSDRIYPALEGYTSYLQDAEQVNPDALFGELEILENQIAQDLVRHPLAYELYKDVRWIERQERFFSLNMIPQEWQQQKSTTVADIYRTHAEIGAFVDEQVAALGYRFATPTISKSDLKTAFRGASDFYRDAEARDGEMFAHLLKTLDKYDSDHTVVAFIAGGFHTPGLARDFREHGLAYEVIRPQIEAGVQLPNDIVYPPYTPEARLLNDRSQTDFLRRATTLTPNGVRWVGSQIANPSPGAYPAMSTEKTESSIIRDAWKRLGDPNQLNDVSWVLVAGLSAIVITVVVGAFYIFRAPIMAAIRSFRAHSETMPDLRDTIDLSHPDDSGIDLTSERARRLMPGPGGNGGSHGPSTGRPAVLLQNLFAGVAPEVMAGPLAALKVNVDAGVITSPNHLAVVRELIDMSEFGLFSGWDAPGVNDDAKRQMMDQATALDAYYPGGLKGYKGRVLQLAKESKDNFNPLAGKTLQAHVDEDLKGPSDPRFQALEAEGLKGANKLAWVLPAGGKGERLGLKDGIKPEVPLDLATNRPYMEEFIASILAIQAKSNALNGENRSATMMVMASPDNRDLMIRLLENPAVSQGMRVVEKTGDRFETDNVIVEGAGVGTIYVLSQGKVPAVNSPDANLFTEPGNKYKIASEPHGHIDVHTLIKLSGLDAQWEREGRQHVVFIQDTNGPMRNTVLAGLGASIDDDLAFNFMVFTRKAKENYGLITEIRDPAADNGLVARANVEYVNADRMLQDRGGDVADPETGDSPFPGNPNQFIARLGEYRVALEQLSDLPELISYKKLVDGKRTRVEGNMQDIAWRFPADKVGTTKVSPRYYIFAPAKNKIADAAANEAAAKPAEGMQTAEAAFYQGQRLLLKSVGVDIDVDGTPAKFQNVTIPVGAFVSLDPRFATTAAETRNKIQGHVTISNRSSLVIRGENVKIKGLKLDGALEVNAGPGVEVTIDDLDINNAGWKLVELTPEEMADTNVPEALRIRGYKLEKTDTRTIDIQKPGRYVVDADGVHRVGDIEPMNFRAPVAFLGGLALIAIGAFGAIDHSLWYSLIAVVGLVPAAVGVLAAVITGPASSDVNDKTDVHALIDDSDYAQARVLRVIEFAKIARPEGATEPVRVVAQSGIVANVNGGVLNIGRGLLKSSAAAAINAGRTPSATDRFIDFARAIVLHFALYHELQHTRGIRSELLAYPLGFVAAILPFLFGNTTPLPRDTTYSERGITYLTRRYGMNGRMFYDGVMALFGRMRSRITTAEVPEYIGIDADSLPQLAAAPEDGRELSESDEGFVTLISKLHIPAAGTGKANAEVAIYTQNLDDADRLARLEAMIAKANAAGTGVVYKLVRLTAPAASASALFGPSSKNVNSTNTVILTAGDAGLAGAAMKKVLGVPHLALVTFAYSQYGANGDAALGELMNLFNLLVRDFAAQPTLTEEVTDEIVAAIQA